MLGTDILLLGISACCIGTLLRHSPIWFAKSLAALVVSSSSFLLSPSLFSPSVLRCRNKGAEKAAPPVLPLHEDEIVRKALKSFGFFSTLFMMDSYPPRKHGINSASCFHRGSHKLIQNELLIPCTNIVTRLYDSFICNIYLNLASWNGVLPQKVHPVYTYFIGYPSAILLPVPPIQAQKVCVKICSPIRMPQMLPVAFSRPLGRQSPYMQPYSIPFPSRPAVCLKSETKQSTPPLSKRIHNNSA
jgi:hypothetical protein